MACCKSCEQGKTCESKMSSQDSKLENIHAPRAQRVVSSGRGPPKNAIRGAKPRYRRYTKTKPRPKSNTGAKTQEREKNKKEKSRMSAMMKANNAVARTARRAANTKRRTTTYEKTKVNQSATKSTTLNPTVIKPDANIWTQKKGM